MNKVLLVQAIQMGSNRIELAEHVEACRRLHRTALDRQAGGLTHGLRPYLEPLVRAGQAGRQLDHPIS